MLFIRFFLLKVFRFMVANKRKIVLLTLNINHKKQIKRFRFFQIS